MKKRFGQHFISDRRLIQRIVRFANITPHDTVVEIGPGAGALTRELAAAAHRVVAIEIDRDLVPALRAELPPNVEVVEGDALSIDLTALCGGVFHIAGNLPYNVGTPLLKRFIAARERITSVTVMLQKEVADRIRAKPGDPDYGPLSILMQYYAEPVWGFTVPPGAFTPRPKVDSAVIRLEWKREVPTDEAFTDFAQLAFAARRKKLVNNLAAMANSPPREALEHLLEAEGIRVDARPETLSVEAFLGLYKRLQALRAQS